MTSPCHILYVDDNKDSCELVRAMLRFSDLDYEMTCAASAESAIALMAKQAFDLFILDYSLPKMSGVELCHYVRKNNSITPIIFLTARAFPTNRTDGLQAGANDYLVKPNDLERLVETINRLLIESPIAECETSPKSQMTSGMYQT